jgi:N-acetylglutamate synthase-like GNAT family acetyltransferase
LEDIEALTLDDFDEDIDRRTQNFRTQVQQVRPWFGLFKILSLFPNPLQHRFHVYVGWSPWQIGEKKGKFAGQSKSPLLIVVAALGGWNRCGCVQAESLSEPKGIGAQLLRYCLETVWEARTWVLEVNINQKDSLALFRQHGFQPLAELTYWSLPPQLLQELSETRGRFTEFTAREQC